MECVTEFLCSWFCFVFMFGINNWFTLIKKPRDFFFLILNLIFLRGWDRG